VDINYLFLRQQTERSRAESAASDVARSIHEQLAIEYERLIEDATQGRVTFLHSQLEDGSPAIRMIGSPVQD
jgi:hypothetical protein